MLSRWILSHDIHNTWFPEVYSWITAVLFTWHCVIRDADIAILRTWRLLIYLITVYFNVLLINKNFIFDVWLTVHRSSIWNKKPTRCHLVLYLFLLYKLLNMFRATMCPFSGADDLVLFSLTCGLMPWLCRQLDPVSRSCVRWKVRSTVVLRTFQRTHERLTGSNCLQSHGIKPHVRENNTKSSAPEDGHMVARNMLSNW